MAEEKKDDQHPLRTATKESASKKVFVPKVDIYETGEAIMIVADMPGVGANDLEVTLEKNELAIKGTISAPAPAGYSAVYAEFDAGEYRRNFTISNEVDREKIEAAVKDGILRLTLPKAEPLKAKKISIQAV